VELTRVEAYGMNPKKCHEAPRLVSYVKMKAGEFGIGKSIDVGSGQGYLSHLLVTKGGMKVVAIEGNEHNSHESAKRSKVIEDKMGIEGGFETVSRMVNKDNIVEYTQENCFLVGLHTCGDLASTCLRLFTSTPNIKGVMNVGCCYHHLTEFVSPQAEPEVSLYLSRVNSTFKARSPDESLCCDPGNCGYPLSGYIKSQHPEFFLGRLPRTLSISEPQPLHSKNAELTFKKFQYRAAFQALLQIHHPEYSMTYSIGNRIKDFERFSKYALAAFAKMKIDNRLGIEELDEFYDQNYKGLAKKSAIFWVIRSSFSEVIENLIILDRLLFLIEEGNHAEAFTIFDKLQSPRNILVAGFKPT